MIQRVQTIFLFLVAVSMLFMLFFPIWEKSDPNVGETVTLDVFNLYFYSTNEEGLRELVDTKPNYVSSVLAIIIAAVAMFSIFKYENRLLQVKLGALNSFLLLIQMVWTVYLIQRAEPIILPSIQGSYQFGFWMPGLALIANFLANRFIRKDEKLVRSADRIR